MSDPRPPDDGPSWPDNDFDRPEDDSASGSGSGQPSDDQPTNRWWERPQDDPQQDEPWPDAPWVRQPRTDQPPDEQPPSGAATPDEPLSDERGDEWAERPQPSEPAWTESPAEAPADDETAEGPPAGGQPAEDRPWMEPWQEPAAPEQEAETGEPEEEWAGPRAAPGDRQGGDEPRGDQPSTGDASEEPPSGNEPWGQRLSTGDASAEQPTGTEPWAEMPREPEAEEPWSREPTTPGEPAGWEPGEGTWLDGPTTQGEPTGEHPGWEEHPGEPTEPPTGGGPFGWPSRRPPADAFTPNAGTEQIAPEQPWGEEQEQSEEPAPAEQPSEPWPGEPWPGEPWPGEPSTGEPWAGETIGAEPPSESVEPADEPRPEWPAREAWGEPQLEQSQAEEPWAAEPQPGEPGQEASATDAWGEVPPTAETFGDQPPLEQPPAEQPPGDEPPTEPPPPLPPAEEPEEAPDEGDRPDEVPAVAVAAAPAATFAGFGDGWDPAVDGERRRATTAEQAVPWMIGIILALAGIVIVLLALIFTFPGGLIGSASPTPTPSASEAAQSGEASPSVQASPSETPTETAAPTPTPTPVPVYGPLEMVYLGRPSGLAPIYLLRRDFSVDTDPTVMAQAEQGVSAYAWSPDGRYGAAIIAGRALAITPGEAARSLADDVSAISWGWDSKTLYAVRITRSGGNDSTDILSIDFASAAVETLATITYRHPVTAPDPALKEAQFIDNGGLVRLYAAADGNLELWVLGAPGTSTYRIDPGDGKVTEAAGPPVLWAPDGRQRVTLKENSNGTSVLTLTNAGGETLASTQVTGLVSHIRWAPQSNEIVFTLGHLSNAGGVRQDLYVWDLVDGKAAQALTSNAVSFGAAWVGVAPNWMPASP